MSPPSHYSSTITAALLKVSVALLNVAETFKVVLSAGILKHSTIILKGSMVATCATLKVSAALLGGLCWLPDATDVWMVGEPWIAENITWTLRCRWQFCSPQASEPAGSKSICRANWLCNFFNLPCHKPPGWQWVFSDLCQLSMFKKPQEAYQVRKRWIGSWHVQ